MDQPSLLTPLQRTFLQSFFAQPAGSGFFLTGGTALAEFYLHHRYSEDLDLFTLDEDAFRDAVANLPAMVATWGGTVEERVSTVTYREVFIRVPGQPDLKADFMRDAGPQFGNHQRFGNVIVDAELDIAVNKVTALFGRAEAKDFVDLYFLLKKGYDLDELTRLAKEKDTGLTEFYLAGMLREVQRIRSLPRMILPITVEELTAFFMPLAEQMLLKLKPRD